MFLLSSPLHAHALCALSRRLAEFRLQSVLKGLPLQLLTQRSGRKIVSDLPEEQEKRLTSFLMHYGLPEQILAVCLALYPDLVKKTLSDAFIRSLRFLPAFPDEIRVEDQNRATALIKLFYALILHEKASVQPARHFERQLNDALDFRLEAAALERLNDAFYEDEHIYFALPDWKQTNKQKLALEKLPPLFSLRESPDRKKTAESLARTITSMILRDGLIVCPSGAACRCDDQGRLYFIRACHRVSLSAQEHRAIFSFTEAFLSKKYSTALKVLETSDCFCPLGTETFLKETEHETKTLSLAQQANHLLDSFLQNGSPLPFFIRFIVHVLKETEDLCASELQTKAPWDAAKEELSLFLTLKKRPTVTNTAQEFRRAFLFEPHQTERLEIQGKKIPAFQKDPQRLSDMLFNQTLEPRHKPTPWRFRHFILPLVIGVSIIAWLLLQK